MKSVGVPYFGRTTRKKKSNRKEGNDERTCEGSESRPKGSLLIRNGGGEGRHFWLA